MARIEEVKSRSRTVPAALRVYLVTYNLLSTLGWGYVLTLTLIHLFNLDGKSDYIPSPVPSSTLSWFTSKFGSSYSSSFKSYLPPALQPIFERAATTCTRVGQATIFVQSFAIFEVLHSLFGLVRSPVQTTAIQVASRLYSLFIFDQYPEVRSNPFFTSMILAWSATEVIRYTFYAFNLVGMNPYLLLWLRYTTFYVLYPVGASSEAFVNLSSLPSTVALWKLADYVRAGLFVIWWPGLYVMYTHMISQRRKVLGKTKAKPE